MSIFTGHCSFQPCHHHHKVTDPFPSAAASRSNTGPQQPRQEAITYHRIQTDGQPDSTIRPTSYAAAAKLRPSPAPQLGNAPSIPLHRGNTHLSPDKWRQEGTQLFIYNDAQLMMKLLHVTVWLRMFTITAVQKTLGQGWRNRPLCLRPPHMDSRTCRSTLSTTDRPHHFGRRRARDHATDAGALVTRQWCKPGQCQPLLVGRTVSISVLSISLVICMLCGRCNQELEQQPCC